MRSAFLKYLQDEILNLKTTGLYKQERVLTSPQNAHIGIVGGRSAVNFCANNYLGLADHPEIKSSAKEGIDKDGYGVASVRFICGTQTVHKKLETHLSDFLQTEDTILYSSCFDANGGLFETLLSSEDAVISDSLNHASIIDGIRLCKAKRFRYQNNQMSDLEEKLKEAEGCRFKLIATDGVFSMDGVIANLKGICDLADKYNALVMVDDCHATGFLGENGRGTHEYCGVLGRVDILTGTLGKALGGASGGYTSGRKDIIEWLRQRSRPYLFSNALAPAIATASLTALSLISSNKALRSTVMENSQYFRRNMKALGFTLLGEGHPIIPIMLGDARLAQIFADKMLSLGIYVIGFCYPVVPENQARIRTQMSAAHSKQDLDQAIDAFRIVGKELGVIV